MFEVPLIDSLFVVSSHLLKSGFGGQRLLAILGKPTFREIQRAWMIGVLDERWMNHRIDGTRPAD